MNRLRQNQKDWRGGGVRTDGKCVCVFACVLFSSYTYMP